MSRNALFVVPALCGLLVAGCGQENPVSPELNPPPAPPPSLFESAESASDPASAPENEGTVTPSGAALEPALDAEPDPNAPSVTPEIADTNLPVLQQGVDSYRAEFRRLPANLEQVVTARYLRGIPPAPAGRQYVVHPTTGQVESVNK